jgi:hypothetical protein
MLRHESYGEDINQQVETATAREIARSSMISSLRPGGVAGCHFASTLTGSGLRFRSHLLTAIQPDRASRLGSRSTFTTP